VTSEYELEQSIFQFLCSAKFAMVACIIKQVINKLKCSAIALTLSGDVVL
jgi:hypothetical protein